MKSLIRFSSYPLFILAVFMLSSCNDKIDDAAMGKAEFSIGLEETATGKSGDADSLNLAFHLMVSVEDMKGNEILSDELIPIYIFGTGFVSEKIEIPAGEYRLTKFMVINTSGAVVYAAPLAGSPLAYLVKRPLPIYFEIRPEQTTRIVPEVLAVEGYSPDQFGYLNFGMQIVKPLTFYAGAIIDYPTLTAEHRWTDAHLTVYDNKGWHYTFPLEPRVNRIIVRGGSDTYTLVVEKPGFMPLKLQVPARRLMETTWQNPLVLKIPYDGSNIRMLVLQPGPAEGKDAMVSNLEPDRNFGGHPWFEATFLSEPILTVMRANRSIIEFDLGMLPKSAIIKRVVLRLSTDKPVPWPVTYDVTGTPGSEGWFGAVLQQVIEEWDEQKVTWNNLPATVTTNQVYIPPVRTSLNFIELDVTRLFVNEIDVPNHGMLFRQFPDERFPGFRFASSDHPNGLLRPRLTIYFTLP